MLCMAGERTGADTWSSWPRIKVTRQMQQVESNEDKRGNDVDVY